MDEIDLKGSRVLVTGGAGFIGSHIVDALLRHGARVRVLDNLSTGKRENLTAHLHPFAGLGVEVSTSSHEIDVIDFILGDIRDYETVRAAMEGIDIVLHQAALPSVPRSVADPRTSHEVNATGTLNVLHAAKEAGVKRVVYACSSSIYGDNATLPKHEEMTPNPLSPYAVSKLAGEKYCQVFARIYGLHTVSLRYFNVFGPRQDPASQYAAVIPKFITMMDKGERPTIYGDGEQSRDFTFVANVVHANLLAATAPCAAGLVVNCACHGRTTLNQVVAAINGTLGTAVSPLYEPARIGEIKHSFAAIDQAREHLGYEPVIPFAEGLVRTISWYRSRHPSLSSGAVPPFNRETARQTGQTR